jgi:hypothetical protein
MTTEAVARQNGLHILVEIETLRAVSAACARLTVPAAYRSPQQNYRQQERWRRNRSRWAESAYLV